MRYKLCILGSEVCTGVHCGDTCVANHVNYEMGGCMNHGDHLCLEVGAT